MRKRTIAVSLSLAAVLGAGALAGCMGGTTGSGAEGDASAGAPPLMPASHQGRFEDLGAAGCYGCHGASDQANPMLNGAVALPDNHYADGDEDTRTIDPAHAQCFTCHGQS